MKIPRVSVLMPVADPAPYLEEALRSLTSQTVDSWELVLVNDGASAAVESLVREMIPERQLRVVDLSVRQGLSHALNQGLTVARGDLVARLDSDDRALPDRIERQLAFMDENPDVALLGMSAMLIDEHGHCRGSRLASAGRANEALLRRNQFVHSSVMFRRELVARLGGYCLKCHLREDYELWLRIAAHAEVANLAEHGVDYRLSDGQVSRRVPAEQSLRLVSEARLALGRSLEVSGPALRVWDLLWRFAQQSAGHRVLTSLQSWRKLLVSPPGESALASGQPAQRSQATASDVRSALHARLRLRTGSSATAVRRSAKRVARE